jgi:hypothetical protein
VMTFGRIGPSALSHAEAQAAAVVDASEERLAVAFSLPDCDRRPWLLASVALAQVRSAPSAASWSPISVAPGLSGFAGWPSNGEPTAGGDFHPAPKAIDLFS